MRRFLITFAVVLFWAAPTWADGILDLNVSGTFTASQPCVFNCTENIVISFLFDPNTVTRPDGDGWIDPSTLLISSSGFLGSFHPQLSANGELVVSWNDSYVPFKNANGDEIDIWTAFGPSFFPVGTNTIGLDIYSCGIDCYSAYGSPQSYRRPSFETSTVTPVAVPDETSVLSLVLTSVGTVGLVWRWRMRDVKGT